MRLLRRMSLAGVAGVLLSLAVLAGSARGETIRGKFRPAEAEPQYVFWPQSHEKVELTLTWLKASVNLDLFVRCVDEIGMEYIVLMSESAHDRIEHLEFGGWSGGTCRVTIRTMDAGRRTTYLLNIQGSAEGNFASLSGSAASGSRRAKPAA